MNTNRYSHCALYGRMHVSSPHNFLSKSTRVCTVLGDKHVLFGTLDAQTISVGARALDDLGSDQEEEQDDDEESESDEKAESCESQKSLRKRIW